MYRTLDQAWTVALCLCALLAMSCAASSSRETCDNGVDDDQNGLVDCDDPKCELADRCQVHAEVCDDDWDNDRDSFTDCEDPDCTGDVACAPPEICGDGLDNDSDGSVDCADSDCVNEPDCAGVEACDDGVDNDGDGDIDCDDSDCSSTPTCQGNEICFDGVDNDGDGDIDCDDSDCAQLQGCQGTTEYCDDGVDNDGDGDIDCDDSDCAGVPACQPTDPCAGRPDGDYCGSDLGGLATHGSLYTCAGGVTTMQIACSNGCSNGDCNPVVSDPCQSATSGNGNYCGDTLTGGTVGTLYTCSNGVTQSTEVCPSGCKVNPPGTADECQPDSDPCASATSGNGYYCGGNLTGGLATVLYYCQNGTTTSETTCPNGCQMMPPGTPDQCVPTGGGTCCLEIPPGTLTQSYTACGGGGSHYGIDYGAANGTPIYAGISGTVVSSALGYPNCYNNGCDAACWNAFNFVKLQSDCGDPNNAANDLFVYYLHIDNLAPGISNGAHVNQGELVAYVGNSGCSTGPHIHLEVVSVPAGQSAYLSTCNSVNPTSRYCP
ncbi:MAG: M23 family metallopeptidase [bacterium]